MKRFCVFDNDRLFSTCEIGIEKEWKKIKFLIFWSNRKSLIQNPRFLIDKKIAFRKAHFLINKKKGFSTTSFFDQQKKGFSTTSFLDQTFFIVFEKTKMFSVKNSLKKNHLWGCLTQKHNPPCLPYSPFVLLFQSHVFFYTRKKVFQNPRFLINKKKSLFNNLVFWSTKKRFIENHMRFR